MGNDHIDGDAAGPINADHQSVAPAQDSSPSTSALLTKIGVIMAEASKKLAVGYGSSKANQPDPDDVANPEALYEQLELDRQKIQQQTADLAAKESKEEHVDAQFERYEQLRSRYESLLEQIQHARLRERIASSTLPTNEDPNSTSTDQNKLLTVYQLARRLCSAQKARRAAVKDLAQQTADAGVSTKFDVHRKLVSLATGLKEEELDPMAAELVETLEFDRMNGKGAGGESPEPEPQGSATFPLPGPPVSVDA